VRKVRMARWGRGEKRGAGEAGYGATLAGGDRGKGKGRRKGWGATMHPTVEKEEWINGIFLGRLSFERSVEFTNCLIHRQQVEFFFLGGGGL